jgi:hypothetical protein
VEIVTITKKHVVRTELSNEVFLVDGRLEDKWGRPLERCDNPACDRQVKVGTAHCCGGCAAAHSMGVEAYGVEQVLSHTEVCNARHAERQKALG